MTQKLDQMIEEALSAEDRHILEETRELGWFELGLSQFAGKLGWVAWVIMIVQIALFAVGVWCTVRFFGATDTLSAVHWGLPALGLILMATVLKLSLMPQMQADRVIRELRRVELMLASRKN